MFRVWFLLIILGFTCFSCKSEDKKNKDTSKLTIDELLEVRYSKFLDYDLDSLAFARSYSHKEKAINKRPSKDWTSGFFAGNFWQIYKLSGDEAFKERAKAWTAFMEREKFNAGTHDMGFKIYCSFGEGLSVEDNPVYKDIIVQSAKTLSTRYNPHIKSIRSWDFNKEKWQFPVIIDNMMNLELLFEATKISGDSTYHNIAVNHANTTLKNHFRPDHSTWHVLDYDTISGQVRGRVTHQGFGDETAWARGQGWAINGFTMAYRYTKDKKYLDRAEKTANYFIHHKNMPEDGIPYWDFDHPDIPNTSRDVSAATIVASALVELYGYTKNEDYKDYSKKVVNSLKSKNYILPKDLDVPFILDHSFGDWSQRHEMDVPIVYGDYYFLQTMLRLQALN
ncbi:glycoside hydrolase family 88 protein [Hyunsoonleella sp. SJ7]|uniref:Glycoside hydrolase family 88 protein n=1 Tax=Hyunsoonleella aquatilis TaxID=2762758 RepID=A0A923HHV4_9FLAO|nr:glycoside hydrolase family 88 protein [Hyunsoonleella aquatilis]MBC3759600.1 glycoside hydrolase family 88 protein [Hyunsoonleella aquatilis]